MSTALISYLACVGVLTLVAIFATLSWLGTVRDKRQAWLRKLKPRMALATESPVERPIEDARELGLEAVQQHFTVTRRVLIPIVLAIAAFFAALPFLALLPTALTSLMVGIVAMLLAMAIKPIVENAIAGVVVSTSKHFHIGDTITIDGHYGTIEDISTTHTTIKLWDWRRYVMPNSSLLQSKVLNHSLSDQHQWAYVEFYVSYQADLEVVEQLAIAAAKASKYYAGYEDPRFWVMECKPEGIVSWVAAWADSPSDAWLLNHDIRSGLSRAFREKGIACHAWQHQWSPMSSGRNGAPPPMGPPVTG